MSNGFVLNFRGFKFALTPEEAEQYKTVSREIVKYKDNCREEFLQDTSKFLGEQAAWNIAAAGLGHLAGVIAKGRHLSKLSNLGHMAQNINLGSGLGTTLKEIGRSGTYTNLLQRLNEMVNVCPRTVSYLYKRYGIDSVHTILNMIKNPTHYASLATHGPKGAALAKLATRINTFVTSSSNTVYKSVANPVYNALKNAQATSNLTKLMVNADGDSYIESMKAENQAEMAYKKNCQKLIELYTGIIKEHAKEIPIVGDSLLSGENTEQLSKDFRSLLLTMDDKTYTDESAKVNMSSMIGFSGMDIKKLQQKHNGDLFIEESSDPQKAEFTNPRNIQAIQAGSILQNKIATTAELILKKAVIKVDSNPQIKDKVSPDMSEILKNGVEEAIPVTKKMMESFEKLKTLTSKVTDKGSEVLQNLYSSGKSAVQSGLNSIKERLDNVQKQDGTDKKDTQQTETGNEETTTNGETKEPVKGFLSDYPNLKQTLGWFGESPLNLSAGVLGTVLLSYGLYKAAKAFKQYRSGNNLKAKQLMKEEQLPKNKKEATIIKDTIKKNKRSNKKTLTEGFALSDEELDNKLSSNIFTGMNSIVRKYALVASELEDKVKELGLVIPNQSHAGGALGFKNRAYMANDVLKAYDSEQQQINYLNKIM